MVRRFIKMFSFCIVLVINCKIFYSSACLLRKHSEQSKHNCCCRMALLNGSVLKHGINVYQ